MSETHLATHEVFIAFGANETPWLGAGWHEREPWDRRGGAFRYASGRAELAPLSPDLSGGHIAILLAPCAASKSRPVDVALWSGPRLICRARYCDERWRMLGGTLPPHPPDAQHPVTLRITPVFVPHNANGAGDRRPLGARVAAIHLRSNHHDDAPDNLPDKERP